MLKLIMLLATLQISILNLHAQEIRVGQKVPEILLKNVINHSSKEAKLIKDFAGKPLIIDFWFIGCAPCMTMIPRLDSLKRAYKEDLNILLATGNNAEVVVQMFNAFKAFQSVKLPCATSENSAGDLKKSFPHIIEPHDVWIGKDGIVQAITSHEYVTDENVKKFIKNGEISLPLKADGELLSLFFQEPLVYVDHYYTKESNLINYSYFGKRQQNIKGSSQEIRYNKLRNLTTAHVYNSDIVKLYKIALGDYPFYLFHEAFVIQEQKDTLKWKGNPYTYDNIFCYQMRLRDSSIARARKYMQRDLDHFFSLKSNVEKRMMPFYIITKVANDSSIISREKGKAMFIPDADKKLISIRNATIKEFLDQFVNFKGVFPSFVYDQTGIREKLNFEIPYPKRTDFKTLQQAFNKYGLDLRIEQRLTNVVVLRDPDILNSINY